MKIPFKRIVLDCLRMHDTSPMPVATYFLPQPKVKQKQLPQLVASSKWTINNYIYAVQTDLKQQTKNPAKSRNKRHTIDKIVQC